MLNSALPSTIENFLLILLKEQKTVFLQSLLLKMTLQKSKNLNPNEAHVHDMISICMLKICGESILKPWELIFESCIESGKKANAAPAHIKNAKQLKKTIVRICCCLFVAR